MTIHPALPPLLLAAVAVAIVAVLVLLRRRTTASPRYGLVVAAALLLLAAMRPVLGDSEPSVTRIAGDREPNIFLIVDRSADMSATAADGEPRTALARADIDAVIERYPGARFALISFDARPSLDWPLTADSWSLRPILDAATPYARGTGVTTNVGAASNVLRYQLISAVQQFPKAPNLVFYLGAGAPDSTVPQREFRIPEGAVDGGAVLGYDDAGSPRLRSVAEQIGVPYVLREQGSSLDGVLADDAQADPSPETDRDTSGLELYWAPAGIAALLILLELYHALRHLRRTRLDRIEVSR